MSIDYNKYEKEINDYLKGYGINPSELSKEDKIKFCDVLSFHIMILEKELGKIWNPVMDELIEYIKKGIEIINRGIKWLKKT